MNEQAVKSKSTRAIVYCRAAVGNNEELSRQENSVKEYAGTQGYDVKEIFLESGDKMDSLTYHSFRLRAKYREFDILLVSELTTLGNGAIEITHEIEFLNQNGVKVISLKDGELNSETLPDVFRKGFRLVRHNS